MDDQTTTPETTNDDVTSTPLPQKLLIVAGAVTGLIIAGGLAFLKKNSEDQDSLEAFDNAVLEEKDNDPTITE